ncbi:MAG: hypothetical protein J6P31_02420 [Oscillospiraceae bacterium]|nr:hypothetical protein [Oscillospiraceae bacterium]
MAIKTGVSLYSYQSLFLRKMIDIEGAFREMQKIGASGLQMLGHQTPLRPRYPRLYQSDIDRWNELCAKYNIVPACLDAETYPNLYAHRYLTAQEQADQLEDDLCYASKLGFKVVRVLCGVDPEVVRLAIPAAEYYGVKMGLEIHPPLSIDGFAVNRFLEMADKSGSKMLGLIPDFGIFRSGCEGHTMYYAQVMGADPDVLEWINQCMKLGIPDEEIQAELRAHGCTDPLYMRLATDFMRNYQDPEKLRAVKDFVVHFHGKFWRMTEDYQEVSIDYAKVFAVLKDMDWDGYVCSEFEGQRAYMGQACPYEEDEIEQVRRHHVMMNRILAE